MQWFVEALYIYHIWIYIYTFFLIYNYETEFHESQSRISDGKKKD